MVRTGILCLVAFVAESVPNFGPVVNLIGASTFTLTSVVLPPVFYAFLKAREQKLIDGTDTGPVSLQE